MTEHQNGVESAISIMHHKISYADFSGVWYDDEIRKFHFAHRSVHEFEHLMKLEMRKTSLWLTVLINSEIRKKKRKTIRIITNVNPGDTFDGESFNQGHHDSMFLYHVWAGTHSLGMKGTQKSPEPR